MKKLLSLAIMVTLSLVLGGGIALAGDTIKLGGPMPLTGPYAGDGVEMKMAMELAIDDINAMGGVMGKKVEGVYGDVQDLSVEAAVSVYEMLRKAGVQAVISGYSCATTAPLEFWGPTRIPFIEASVRDSYAEMVKSDPKKYANVFQNSQIASDMGIDTGLFLFDIPKKMGWKPPNKKVAIVAFEDPSYAEPAARFQEMAEKDGYQTVIKNLYQFGYGSDWRAVLTKIDAERPAFITIFTILPADAANFTMQFNEYFGDDYNGLLYFLFAPAMPEYLELAGETAEKVVFNTMPIIFFSDEVKELDKKWLAKFKEPRYGNTALYVYDAVMMWYEAVKKTGCVECYDKVGNAIRSTIHKGLLGTYEFKDDNSALYGEDRIPIAWYQIQNGQPVGIQPPDWANKGAKFMKQPGMK